jgi:ParB family chromosome partitioning protein
LFNNSIDIVLEVIMVVKWKDARVGLDLIDVPKKQVRNGDFNEDSLSNLSNSIREVGQLQALVVQPFGDKFRLVFGERRLRALAMAGHKEADVRIVDANLTRAEIIQMQLIENVAREDLNPLELAFGIKDWMQETGCTATEVAAKLGMSNADVSKILPLADLPPIIQAQIKAGTVPRSAGYELSRIKDAGEQAALAAQVASGQLTRDGLSGIVKRKGSRQRKEAGAEQAARIKAELSNGRSIIVAGVGLTSLDTLIAWLEELTTKARKLRPKGLELSTFAKFLRDEAKS